MAKWKATEYREKFTEDHAPIDRDIMQAQAIGSLGGDLRPGDRRRQEVYKPVLRADYVRCPGCGGKVIMPCLLCGISDITLPANAFNRLLAEADQDDAAERVQIKRHRRKKIKAKIDPYPDSSYDIPDVVDPDSDEDEDIESQDSED